MKNKLHILIFVAMAAGLIAGLWLSSLDPSTPLYENSIWLADLLGKTVFIGLLKMIVAPLIFISILAAIVSLASRAELWRIGWKTMAFYLTTTSIAVTLGLVFVLTIQPGLRGDRDMIRASWAERRAEIDHEFGAKTAKVDGAEGLTAADTIKANIQKIVVNPFKALSEGQTLGVIFFACLLGIALITVGKEGRPVIPIIQGMNAAIMRITGWIMAGSPFFIFCLITSLVGQHGPGVFELLFWYVLTVLVAIAAHVVVLLTICKTVGKMSPWTFLKGIREAWMIAFSTRSSAATLPVTMECVEENLGVRPEAANFILPLGATINMDGTALYEGVAVIFLIQLFGGMPGAEIVLTPVLTVVIFLTAVLASVGAAAVPDAGLITMVLVANAVGLSVEYIPLIFAVDAFLDMFRTSTNVMGDAVGAVVINRLEGDRMAAALATDGRDRVPRSRRNRPHDSESRVDG